jgi:hypothetical protein
VLQNLFTRFLNWIEGSTLLLKAVCRRLVREVRIYVPIIWRRSKLFIDILVLCQKGIYAALRPTLSKNFLGGFI